MFTLFETQIGVDNVSEKSTAHICSACNREFACTKSQKDDKITKTSSFARLDPRLTHVFLLKQRMSNKYTILQTGSLDIVYRPSFYNKEPV